MKLLSVNTSGAEMVQPVILTFVSELLIYEQINGNESFQASAAK
jgi:hypothetical protein